MALESPPGRAIGRSRPTIRSRLLLAAVLPFAGCASVPREAGFAEVSRLAAERGVRGASWNRAGEDPALARRVNELLEEPLTADAAVAIALVRSPRLRAVYEELSLAQADVVQAGLPRNPTVAGRLRLSLESGPGAGPEIAFAQSIGDLLRLPARRRQAEATFQAAKLRVTGEILDAATEARIAFYDLQAAAQLRELRSTALEALEAGYDLAERLHAAGNVNDYDLAQQRVQFEQSKLDLASAEARVEVARARVDAVLGLSGKATAWRFVERLPPIAGADPEGGESRAVERSLELAALREEIAAAGEAVGLAKTFAFLPSLSLGGGAEREVEGGKSLGPSVGFPIPLFDQGQAQIASAEARLRRLEELQAAIAIDIRAAVRARRAELGLARRRVESLAKVVLPLRQHVAHQAQLQYNAMQIGAFQLLRAREAEIEAGARFVSELRTYWLARAELERLLEGRLGRIARAPVSESTESIEAEIGH